MKIDKKQFNKLKQLDRIEFRQKLNSIKEFGFNFQDCFWYILIISTIFLIGGKILGNFQFIDVSIVLFLFAIFICFIDICLIIGCTIIRHKEMKILMEEYFKVEVKK